MGLTKARIRNKETGEEVECLFNPTEYTLSKTNPWQSKSVVGKNVPRLEFTGGGAQTLAMDLFLDASDNPRGSIAGDVEKLFKLTLIQEKLYNVKSNKSRPPLCVFSWGPSWSFTAVVMSIESRYTLFREDGSPLRATCKIKFQEAEDDSIQPKQNPTSFTPGGRRRREVRPHDTLALIAYEEYGDSSRWRVIAEENDIDDPGSIRAGQVLAIPPRS